MIFKSVEQIDELGNSTQRLAWIFKDLKIGDKTIFSNEKGITDVSNENLFKLSIDEDLQQLKDFDALMAKGNITVSEAITQLGIQKEEVKEACRNYKDGATDVDTYTEAQRNALKANNELKGSFGGLSSAFKAMAFNIGAELAIALALQAVMWGLNKLNEEFHITAASKVEAMENAVNNYNDALEQSSDNIDTIKDLEEEFTTLARGVNDAGENIGLSADEYERYHEIVAELVAINPELVQTYDDEGNAIRSNLEEVVN